MVFQVSEEVGLTSNDDEVDLDLAEDASEDVKVPSKTPTAEHNLADEVRCETHLSTASNVDCQDTSTGTLNAGNDDERNHEVSVEAQDEANCTSNNESLPQTCSDNPVADSSPQPARNIPGKALPVAVDSSNTEPSVVDTKSDASVSDAAEVHRDSAVSQGLASSAAATDIYTADVKSDKSQQSKKHDTKSVSMTVCILVL